VLLRPFASLFVILLKGVFNIELWFGGTKLVGQTVGHDNCILNGLVGTLSGIWKHGVTRMRDKRHLSTKYVYGSDKITQNEEDDPNVSWPMLHEWDATQNSGP
jgi:hypothetical protein